MSSIVFLRSNKIISDEVSNASLYELLKLHLFVPSRNLELDKNLIFEQVNIVVPTQSFAIWLQDKITTDYTVCANIDFVVLLGPILNKIYLANNPGAIISDLENATYVIYKYLCQHKIKTTDANEINKYLYYDEILDKKRAYFLATQLHKIFHEYLYIRTNEVLNLDNSSIPLYQREILNYLFQNQGDSKNFLDVYKYFMNLDITDIHLKLPKSLFIFGLTSVYSSQLQIIKKLANRVTVYWYYKTCSFEYYGDLLSSDVKNRLNKKYFKNPDLHLEDLYLNDANPLMTNLGQQSREFIELLNQNDITVYDVENHNSYDVPNSFLSILQNDVAMLNYRILKRKRLMDNNPYYQDPIMLNDNDNSIKINVCHNKMREVQVMFNEIAELINSGIKAKNILITAPDIDDYAIYINAVFANEFLADKNGYTHQIKCNVTGNRRYSDYSILEVFSLISNMPYGCSVNYLLEILMSHVIQISLKINLDDVELVRKWLVDNHIYFGFDEKDYKQYGYENYQIHSLKQFLINITMGACISGNNVYDNIDSKQIPLCNKLIKLINLLEDVRNQFYIDIDNYRELTGNELYLILSKIEEYLITDEDNRFKSQKFLGRVNNITRVLGEDIVINLPIFNMIYDEYANEFNKSININGYITALSMQYARNIPYDYVYMLGLNFESFPRIYEPHMLSILSKSWYLADRNYTNEDKQTFLDIFLSTNTKIYFSYIGRSEKDNGVIEPSSILTEVLNVMRESFLNLEHLDKSTTYKNLIEYHALHPFYKNNANNYSKFWVDISEQIEGNMQLNVDNFKIRNYVSAEDFIERFNPIKLDNITNTFLYTNTNLYKALNINTFDKPFDLLEVEGFSVEDRNIARELFQYFEQNFMLMSMEEIFNNVTKKGIVAYRDLGIAQFNKYYDFYRSYNKKRGVKTHFEIKVKLPEITLEIKDILYIENDNIIITDKFENITSIEPGDKKISYELKMKSLVLKAILSQIEQFKDYPVILRNMNTDGLYHNYLVELHDTKVASTIYQYYLESYKRPTLIHKSAISKFADTEKNPHMAAENTYSYGFNNYELDKLKTDFIYAKVADTYFEFTRQNNLANDIIIIGNILSNITFTRV